MGASKKWNTPQNLEADKSTQTGFDLSTLSKMEYENHPFQPCPLINRDDSERSTANANASARLPDLHRDLRQFDRDSSRRVLAH